MTSIRRSAAGALVALGGIVVLCAVMVPLRPHLSIATPALVLVIPVVVGVAVGGFAGGVVAVLAGFLAYDLFFIPPYGTLSVGAAENWIALIVYAVVMLVVARVVSGLQVARAEARRREIDTRRLYVLSDLLIGDKPLPELLELVVTTIHHAFGPSWVALLLPIDDALEVAATAGEPLSDEDRASLAPVSGRLEAVRAGREPGTARIVLTATGRPIGLLAMSEATLDSHDWELLHTFANQAALALERSQLRAQAVRTELLEEVDRWRAALMGAVSHDLRTPLATVKTAVTTLRRDGSALSPGDRDELLELIESQSDSLARLVTNLLDMTRVQAGALELHREVTTVGEVVEEAVAALDASGSVLDRVAVDLPLVLVDPVLMTQAVGNVIENALRHSPEGRAVEIDARVWGDAAELWVTDHGPGVPAGERDRIFEMFNGGGGGRAGLGLSIAKAFVEAHGQTIRVEQAPGGGARFVITMPLAGATAQAG
jgi:two-component system sensor histidine kinase KdpD